MMEQTNILIQKQKQNQEKNINADFQSINKIKKPILFLIQMYWQDVMEWQEIQYKIQDSWFVKEKNEIIHRLL